MIVMKFGGTSLGDAKRIDEVARLIEKNSDVVVVCSAMSGVTNKLVTASQLWESRSYSELSILLNELKSHFKATCYELFSQSDYSLPILTLIDKNFNEIEFRITQYHDQAGENWLLAMGEIVTSQIISHYLNYLNIQVTWLNSLELVRLDQNNEPSVKDIHKRFKEVVGENISGRFLTQGYICLDNSGNTSNLKRGGSDYTATLIGAAIGAESIEIWTDIDGVRNNDPRIVENTFPIRELSFEEAAELAYFGAKILHPSCVWPASSNNIPIRLNNTLDPDAPGTLIHSGIEKKGITAVAAKDGITVIRIRSDRMLNAYGFLNRIFSIFEKYRTPIDVITTSEVSVSVTIDNPESLDSIKSELSEFGNVEVEYDQAIICVVGDIFEQHQDRAVRILESLRHFNVNMISFGGSRNNITLVVPHDQRTDILKSLNSYLFENNRHTNDSWLISHS